mgnify:CR=1 FL=1
MKKNAIVKSEKIVDPNTGEVTYQDTIERQPDELISVWNPRGKESRTKHIKINSRLEIKRKLKTLTGPEKIFLLSVLPYMEFRRVLFRSNVTAGTKKQPLSWADIEKITGLEPRARRKAVNGLMEKKILAYLVNDKKRGLVINPQFALNGKIPSISLINTFNTATTLEEAEEEYTT